LQSLAASQIHSKRSDRSEVLFRAFLAQRLACAATQDRREVLDQLNAAGVARERIILDPGMGYFLGSNPETSLFMLARLAQLRSFLNVPCSSAYPKIIPSQSGNHGRLRHCKPHAGRRAPGGERRC
jgi:dihydropteroate synthase